MQQFCGTRKTATGNTKCVFNIQDGDPNSVEMPVKKTFYAITGGRKGPGMQKV